MDEEERTRHLRRLRKRGVDSNFPAPPPLDFSRRCKGTCRKAPSHGPSPSCLGTQAAVECTSSPGCRHVALLAASRAQSSMPHGRNGMLWTRPTSGRRCAAPATLQWIAQRRVARVTPHAEPRRGARRETERELLAITFKTSPHAAYHPPARPGVYLGLSATHRGRYSPLSRAARGAHPISPPPGRESKPRLSSCIGRPSPSKTAPIRDRFANAPRGRGKAHAASRPRC